MFRWAKVTVNEMQEEYKYTAGMLQYSDNYGKARAKAAALLLVLRLPFVALKQKYCRHDWEVDSYITPDSGNEDFTCKKCGLYHSINYY